MFDNSHNNLQQQNSHKSKKPPWSLNSTKPIIHLAEQRRAGNLPHGFKQRQSAHHSLFSSNGAPSSLIKFSFANVKRVEKESRESSVNEEKSSSRSDTSDTSEIRSKKNIKGGIIGGSLGAIGGGIIGGIAGAMIGAGPGTVGMMIGAMIGGVAGPIGIAAGGLIGLIAGGLIGLFARRKRKNKDIGQSNLEKNSGTVAAEVEDKKEEEAESALEVVHEVEEDASAGDEAKNAEATMLEVIPKVVKTETEETEDAAAVAEVEVEDKKEEEAESALEVVHEVEEDASTGDEAKNAEATMLEVIPKVVKTETEETEDAAAEVEVEDKKEEEAESAPSSISLLEAEDKEEDAEDREEDAEDREVVADVVDVKEDEDDVELQDTYKKMLSRNVLTDDGISYGLTLLENVLRKNSGMPARKEEDEVAEDVAEDEKEKTTDSRLVLPSNDNAQIQNSIDSMQQHLDFSSVNHKAEFIRVSFGEARAQAYVKAATKAEAEAYAEVGKKMEHLNRKFPKDVMALYKKQYEQDIDTLKNKFNNMSLENLKRKLASILRSLQESAQAIHNIIGTGEIETHHIILNGTLIDKHFTQMMEAKVLGSLILEKDEVLDSLILEEDDADAEVDEARANG